MDQTTALSINDRRRAVAGLTEFLVQSIEAARAVDKPFFHLEFDRVFPDDIYAQILALKPEARCVRSRSSRLSSGGWRPVWKSASARISPRSACSRSRS